MKVSELLALDKYEFDRWVAEHVMGDTKKDALWTAIDFHTWDGMGRIVNRMKSLGWEFLLMCPKTECLISLATFTKHEPSGLLTHRSEYKFGGDDEPEAVVIAAGLALGVLTEEE